MKNVLIKLDNVGRYVPQHKLDFWKKKGATVVDEKDYPETKESEAAGAEGDEDVSGEFTGNIVYAPDGDDEE